MLQPIQLHTLSGCPVDPSATLDLVALGDFDSDLTSAESLPLGEPRELGLPLGALALEARASSPRGAWHGAAPTNRSGAELLLWPAREPCALFSQSTFPRADSSLGYHPETRELLVAGGFVASPGAARVALVSLGTGEAREVPGGLLPARAGAQITPFGDGFLLSGGVDPRERLGGDFNLATPLRSASHYDPALGRFDPNRQITISPRANHAAVRIRSGDTLLIGGRSPETPALATLEAVSPETHSARLVGLTELTHRRRDPQSFVLDDGRVFVGGGTDATNQPVQTVEWLSSDASEHLGTTRLHVSGAARFAPLPGGSVVVVGACASPCERPQAAAAWIDAWGRAHALAPLPGDLEQPVLLPASRGAPWLVTGSGSARRVYELSAWDGAFVPRALAPAPPSEQALNLDGGTLVWLTDGQLTGHRFDVRGSYASDLGPLLLAQPGVGTQVTPSAPLRGSGGSEGGEVRYDAQGLSLSGRGAVHLTDTRYRALTLTIQWQAGPAPLVVLHADDASLEVQLGGAACPWPQHGGQAQGPAPTGTNGTPGSLEVRRAGADVVLTAGGVSQRCTFPELAQHRVRVSLGAAGAAPSHLRSFEIRRTP